MDTNGILKNESGSMMTIDLDNGRSLYLPAWETCSAPDEIMQNKNIIRLVKKGLLSVRKSLRKEAI